MDKYLFSYADPRDPPLKRGLIRLVETATGQPHLKRLYLDNQRAPRAGESFWEAAVRALELDVRYDAAALTAIPRTGPIVVVANHPYGVLDEIVICWLMSKVRSDFVVLTHAVLTRARETRDAILPVDFSRNRRGAADQSRLAGGGARAIGAGRGCGCVSGRRRLDRARPARPQARDRLAVAAFRLAAHPAGAGDCRARVVRGAK